MSKNKKIYYESFEEAIERNRKKIPEVHKKLKDASVKYVLSSWIDLHGIPKTKPVPMSDFELLCLGKGPQFAAHSISFVPELTPADSDQIMLPDLDCVYICPWDKSIAIIFADFFWEGKPYNVCPRQALKRAIQKAQDAGYKGMAGIEPEFIAMKYDEDGKPIKAIDSDPIKGIRPRRQAFGYDVEHSLDSMYFFKELIDILENLGWNLHDVVAEGAYSQFELDFHYTNLLEMADRLVFLRILLKEIAKKHNMFITFMPKPFENLTGNGCHAHISLWNGNKNLFLDKGDKLGLTRLAYNFLGGILYSAEALSAFFNPSINSYRRIDAPVTTSGATWSPSKISYTGNNRTHMIRIPDPGRFELRLMDGSANPYLLQAGVIAAGIDGMEKKRDPGQPLYINMYTDGDNYPNIKKLPSNLENALEHLSDSAILLSAFGEKNITSYLKLKEQELKDFNSKETFSKKEPITDWEKTNTLDC